MMQSVSSTLPAVFALLTITFSAVAQDAKVLCFEKKTAQSEEQLYLVIEGYMVRGTAASSSEGGSAEGRIFGNVREADGVLHVTYNYLIDGHEPGSEEQLMKLGKGSIAIAEGELEERGPGQLVLKNPKAAKFTKVLKQVPLSFIEADAPEAKAIAKAVDAVLSDSVGFRPGGYENGFFRLAGDWALFQGYLTVPEGIKPDPAMVEQLQNQEFQAQLKKNGKGVWQVIRHGFALPDGINLDYTSLDDAPAPWQLMASMKNRG